jgi:P4 family phage/plasmid primase-like protien
MQKTSIHKLIDKYAVNTDKHNILSQPGMKCCSGKWFIPDDFYPKFQDELISYLEKNPKAELHFLEKPNEFYNMVKVDVDLRFKATEEELKQKKLPERRYNEDLVAHLINIIVENLMGIIEVPETYKIYIQEKTLPRIIHQEKIIKDGIHIIIPEIVMSNTALYYLRDKIIADDTLKDLLNEIGNITAIPDVIDKRIIWPNPWFIYGCGKPDDNGNYYKVSTVYKVIHDESYEDGYDLTILKTNKSLQELAKLFSNFGKVDNVKYTMEFDGEISKYKNDKNNKYVGKNNEAMMKLYVQDTGNFRRASTLTQAEIKPYLDCLKASRYDDYEDWCRIGLSLFNMDYRNYDLWRLWSAQSEKYNEDACIKKWYNEFPKAGKYNMGFNKIKELAKIDNRDKFYQIININKKHFFQRWLQAHMDEKDIYIKNLSIGTITHFINCYIKDYASFNIACALPGGASSVYYKFDKHKWTEDKAANKIYTLLSDTIKKELTDIHIDLKEKMIASQRAENEQSKNRNARGGIVSNNSDDDMQSDTSYQRLIQDDRAQVINTERLADEQKDKIYTRLQHEKCSALIQFIDKLSNKKNIIEELSQKCFDEDFYKKLDVNNNVFVCNNGVLDLDLCIFRDGQPSDMMTISANIDFPKEIDTLEAQDYMCAIQEWLDKIFPDDEVQNYVLNVMACKLSGSLGLLGERFHIFTGSGANGKSQFFKLIKESFGDYYLAADNTLLNTPKRDPNSASPAIAILKAKRVVSLTEPKNNIPFESDKVKELVSGDPLTCRHLNKDPIQFIPQYALFLQCNDIPDNESTDDGFWRKIFVVPCESKFILKDDDMYKLNDTVKYPNHFIGCDQSHLYKDWAPYFLYLLFQRYKVLKDAGFRFIVPEKMKAATRRYQAKASPYTQFFHDKLEEIPGYKIDAATLYSEFQSFVGRDFKTQKSTFLRQMERMIGKPRGKNKEYYGFRIFNTAGEPIESMDANVARAQESDDE